MLESLSDNYPVTIAVLTPGMYNSAYFEHAYLAQQMGAELVEGSDLVVKNDFVYMVTTSGLQKVDVIKGMLYWSMLPGRVWRTIKPYMPMCPG